MSWTNRAVRRLLVLLAAGVLAQAGTADAAPIPISFTFTGTLADGGFFSGSMTYGAVDMDRDSDGLERPGIGRYFGLAWDVFVDADTLADTHFSSSLNGPAQLETYEPSPPRPAAIGVIFLAPGSTEQRGLSPHFLAPPGFDADVQPTLADFGDLIPGSADPDPAKRFGVYRDGFGGAVVVSSMQIQAVPEPGILALLGLGVSGLALRRRLTHR